MGAELQSFLEIFCGCFHHHCEFRNDQSSLQFVRNNRNAIDICAPAWDQTFSAHGLYPSIPHNVIIRKCRRSQYQLTIYPTDNRCGNSTGQPALAPIVGHIPILCQGTHKVCRIRASRDDFDIISEDR